MGKKSQGLKKAGRKAAHLPAFQRGSSSTNPDRKLPDNKKKGFYRSKSTIKLLNLYKSKPQQGKEPQPTAPARIQPDRRWFGNTRVIDQSKLSLFREALSQADNNPYSVVLKRSKLPLSLLAPSAPGRTEHFDEGGQEMSTVPQTRGSAILSLQSFSDTFGDKRTRKRPQLQASDLGELARQAERRQASFQEGRGGAGGEDEGDETAFSRDDPRGQDSGGETAAASEKIFKKGTSRRIWGELYKVIDSSDVIVQVVDARDPLGTRCFRVEKYLRSHKQSKHMILVLNKIDLIPSQVARIWVRRFSKELPTLPFQAKKQEKAAGRLQLFQLLRQYVQLMSDRKHVSVGFIGYPNVGKSSIINALRSKQVCRAAPIPGETRVWQYVALTKRLYLIDCPGIVPASASISDSLRVIRGVVRPERIACPEEHIDEVLQRVQEESIRARYSLPDACKWTDSESFLAVLAKKKGKLLKGGEPDISTAARIVLYDLQRGRLPYYVPPPVDPNAPEEESGDENKGKKRDRENREDEEDGEGGDEGEEGDEEEENGEEESAGPPGKKESSAANAMKRRRQTEAAEAEKDVSEKKKAKTAEAAPGKKTPTGTQTPGPSGKRGTRKAGEKKKTQGMKVVSEADLAKTLVDEFEA
ncbi:putative nucleolar gtp-binding protein 2 [Toxoplasma gondii GT1]|uniref:Nucleolar GTP-binding protein 2 n=3 Tax=Toxoplasma gondii TaxID=5811 RepID=S7UI53_TOXGG|nr:putative nucleolar gtp-binding protein 2 [Toxoplasma gondii GT1]KAF4644736.1 putative nucleolar gtp-binding protein 2 [Toxoplasma gondii]